jgi:hypothetical protein
MATDLQLINSLTSSKLREGNGTTKTTIKCGLSDQLQLHSYMLKFIDTPGQEPDGDNEAIYKEIRTTTKYLYVVFTFTDKAIMLRLANRVARGKEIESSEGYTCSTLRSSGPVTPLLVT